MWQRIAILVSAFNRTAITVAGDTCNRAVECVLKATIRAGSKPANGTCDTTNAEGMSFEQNYVGHPQEIGVDMRSRGSNEREGARLTASRRACVTDAGDDVKNIRELQESRTTISMVFMSAIAQCAENRSPEMVKEKRVNMRTAIVATATGSEEKTKSSPIVDSC